MYIFCLNFQILSTKWTKQYIWQILVILNINSINVLGRIWRWDLIEKKKSRKTKEPLGLYSKQMYVCSTFDCISVNFPEEIPKSKLPYFLLLPLIFVLYFHDIPVESVSLFSEKLPILYLKLKTLNCYDPKTN